MMFTNLEKAIFMAVTSFLIIAVNGGTRSNMEIPGTAAVAASDAHGAQVIQAAPKGCDSGRTTKP